MKPLPGWKRLLLQALDASPKPPAVSRWNPLPSLAWWRHALRQGGILGPSPISDSTLARLWWSVHGQPAAFVDACRQRITDARRRPRPGLENLAPLLILLLLVLPHLANTSAPVSKTEMILQKPLLPGQDHDLVRWEWPEASDYPESPVATHPDPSDAAGLHGREWLQTLPPGTHGLQLMSASNPENILRFCSRQHICGQSAAIASRINGKPLWRLMFGQYPNRKQAREAVARLPESLRQLKPWPRSYASLRDPAEQAR